MIRFFFSRSIAYLISAPLRAQFMPEFSGSPPYEPRGRPDPATPPPMTSSSRAVRVGRTHQNLLGGPAPARRYAGTMSAPAPKSPVIVLRTTRPSRELYGEFKSSSQNNAVRYSSLLRYYHPKPTSPRDITSRREARSTRERAARMAATAPWSGRHDVIRRRQRLLNLRPGSQEDYRKMWCASSGRVRDRDEVLLKFVDLQYARNDVSFERGTFSRRGERSSSSGGLRRDRLRIEIFGDESRPRRDRPADRPRCWRKRRR